MADKRGRDVLRTPDPVDWGSDELGLRVLKPRASADFVPRRGVPAAPAPLLATWMMAAGQRLERSAFADGDTVDGRTFEEAFAIAAANERAVPFTTEPLTGVTGSGILRPHAATLLAVPEALLPLANEVAGDLLVAAPTPQMLMLFGTDQDDLDQVLRVLASTMVAAGPAGLTPLLYRVAGTDQAVRIEEWDPGADSPLRPHVERARHLQVERYYGPMLQYEGVGTYAVRGRGAVCAKPQWSRDAEGGIRSFAVWLPDMHPVLLPPVDWIAVNLKGSRAAPQLWLTREELAQVAGIALTATNELGLPIDVVEWPGWQDDRDHVALKRALKDAGARTTAAMGGAGDAVHVLDLVR